MVSGENITSNSKGRGMIEVFTGTPGSGKSLHATAEGLQRIGQRKKNRVVANFPITEGKNSHRWIFQAELTVQDLIKRSRNGFFGKEDSCLLLIDEAASIFNARDWNDAKNNRREWLDFFAQHRKLGYEIIMVSIDIKMLDKQIRSVCESQVKHVKLKNHWAFKWLPWPVFLTSRYWLAGAFRGKIGTFIYKPWVAKRYDTMRMFTWQDGEPETGPEGVQANACGTSGTDTGLQAGTWQEFADWKASS